VPGWNVPTEFGGANLGLVEILEGYEQLAGACLTTTFILSQRDAAVRRIRDASQPELAKDLLRPLACGGKFATVAISQLTTSRQHGAPALVARQADDNWILDGVMPWVTGADQADHLVAGAALDDGRQILIVVPTELPGLHVEPPAQLAALCGSRTSQVTCQSVAVPNRWLLAGPIPQVMSGRGGTGGLETSCLAIGHAGAAIDDIVAECKMRPDLQPIADSLNETRLELRTELHRLAVDGATPEAALNLRTRANALALNATQAALTAAKGAGFVRPHPAQRRARQALFFLVWSCPRPTADAMLRQWADCPL
jgi:alkylation response protein AidB-like acyl-CoA dehydrogenase